MCAISFYPYKILTKQLTSAEIYCNSPQSHNCLLLRVNIKEFTVIETKPNVDPAAFGSSILK